MVEWIQEQPNFSYFLQKHEGDGFYALAIKIDFKKRTGYVLTEFQIEKKYLGTFNSLFPEVAKRITDRCEQIIESLGARFSIDAFKDEYRVSRPHLKTQLKPSQGPPEEENSNLSISTLNQLNGIMEKLANIETLLMRDTSIYLDIDEAATFTKHAARTLRNLVSKKRIPFIKRGSRTIFRRDDLIKWMDEGRNLKESHNANIRI